MTMAWPICASASAYYCRAVEGQLCRRNRPFVRRCSNNQSAPHFSYQSVPLIYFFYKNCICLCTIYRPVFVFVVSPASTLRRNQCGRRLLFCDLGARSRISAATGLRRWTLDWTPAAVAPPRDAVLVYRPHFQSRAPRAGWL